MATLLWVDSFDHQIASAVGYGTNGARLYDESQNTGAFSFVTGRTGYAMRCDESFTAAAINLRKLWATGIASATPRVAVASFWLKIGTLGTASCSAVMARFVTANNMGVGVDTSGHILARVIGGSDGVSSGTYNDGNWHHITVKVDSSTGTFTVNVQIDGGDAISGSQTATAEDIQSFFIGTSIAGNNLIFDVDGLVLSGTSGDYPLGPYTVYSSVPDGDGTHVPGVNGMEDNAGADINGTTVTAYPKLNVFPPPTTPYVQQNGTGTGEYAEVTFADKTASGIVAVVGLTVVWAAGTPSNNGTSRIVDASGTTLTNIYSGNQSDTAFRYQAQKIAVPAGGWDTDFNGVKGRIGFSSDGSPIPRWSGLMLQYAIASALTKTHQTDAVILKTATKTHQTDAVILKTATKTHQTDALVKATLTQTHQADAIVLKTLTVTHQADAVLLKTGSVAHDTDAIIVVGAETKTVSHDTDALVLATLTQTHQTDAVIFKTLAVVHATDALVLRTASASHLTDALIQATLAQTHAVDAVILKALAVTHDADAVVLKAAALSHSTDALILKTGTASHDTDAYIAARLTLSHATDASILLVPTVTHGTDAVIVKTLAVTHDTDAVILKMILQTQSVDAILLQTAIQTHATDAIVQASLARTHTTDAIVLKTSGFQVGGGTEVAWINSTTNVDTYDTTTHGGGQWTPNAARTYVAIVEHSGEDVAAQLSGNGLTWYLFAAIGDAQTRFTAFIAAGAGGSLGDVTVFVSTGNATGMTVAIIEFTDVDYMANVAAVPGPGTPIPQVVTALDQASPGELTLATPVNYGSRAVFAVALSDNGDVTETWTEISDRNRVSPTHALEIQWSYDRFLTSASASWTGGQNSHLLAFELAALAFEHSTDAVVQKTLTQTHSTDAVILKTLIASHDTDAIVGNPSQTIAHSTDALILTTGSKTHLNDAVLLKTDEVSQSSDALIVKPDIKTHQTDAIIQKTENLLHSTDVYIAARLTVTHQVDTIIQSFLQVSHSTDTVIRRTLTISHNSDAHIVPPIAPPTSIIELPASYELIVYLDAAYDDVVTLEAVYDPIARI